MDWLRRCRELGGLAVGAHFPCRWPRSLRTSTRACSTPSRCNASTPRSRAADREWYRYLDAGYRLPIVGGTDKMTATVPVGQMRTWARLGEDVALTFDTWADAVRRDAPS